MTNTNKAYAVIMAGGSGTRFWPLSRTNRPKQFLALGPDDRSLLRATAERVWNLLSPERTFVVT
ncbi:MAG: sugar phosphate nucleotidyltransferase, partial [Myxococcales bacterium]|nr:sugar phosphate nucleotidyltransferase [Myxococcales bacterium]